MSKWTKEKIQALSFSEEQFDFVDTLADDYLANLKKLIAQAATIKELKGENEELEGGLQGHPTIKRHVDGDAVWTECRECGVDVSVDEDGCCSCGLDALRFGKFEQDKTKDKEIERLKGALEDVKLTIENSREDMPLIQTEEGKELNSYLDSIEYTAKEALKPTTEKEAKNE